MFWKKKDKDEEAPKGAKKAEEAPRREERRPEPARGGAQPTAQGRTAPASGQPNLGPGAAIDAALTAGRGPAGAPISAESVLAQARAADRLAQSNDGTNKQAAKDLAAGQLDRGFDALQQAAQKLTDGGRDKTAAANAWRTLGALAFNVQAGRAKTAYENLFNIEPRQFWDGIFLARLRGIGGQKTEARDAATAAVAVAADDVERGLGRAELGLISLALNEEAQALLHAEESIALARRVGCGPGGSRDFIGRLVLLGDAAMVVGEGARARAAFTEALDLLRRDGLAAPNDTNVARAVCEVLEKCAAACFQNKDQPAALKHIEEAVNVRRRLQSALPGGDGVRGLAQSLTLKAEVLRAGGDRNGAKAAYEENLALLRKVGEAAPRDAAAQREVWVAMWRMASAEAGMDWRQVAGAMERMESQGALDDDGKRFLGEAKRRAAA